MLQTILSAILASGIATAILAFLLKSWIEAKLKSAVEHEYQKQLEIFRRNLNRKEKVELVAELLAEYMKTPYGEVMSREQRFILNRLSLEASIWLPSDLAIEVSKRLQNKPDAKSPFDLVLLARKELLGDESLTGAHVTIWSSEKEKRGDPLLARL